ncbi:MAG: extracellular solute-binding protein [Chloroflexi bacterium]|nr:extracellular solute-binding protein [Chloroflexota bacterium]
MATGTNISRRAFLQRLAALGAVTATAAACAPAAPPAAPKVAEPTKAPAAPAQPTAAPPAKVEIKGNLQVVQKNDFFPAMNDWIQTEVKSFCKEKGWPVEVTYEAGYTGGTPFLEKMAAAASAGMPADLLMHTDGLVDLVRLKVVDPVTEIVNQVAAKWGNPSARQKFDFVKEGQWYYVPFFQRSDGGWFQRPVFKDKGIDLQKVRSYPDLWEACLAVTDPGKQVYGWGVTINRCGDGDWFRNRVMHGWGAYIQDETGQYVTINTPEMVKAITIMTDLYIKDKWKPMLPPGVLAWTDTSNNENYLAGKLAYTQNGGTVYGKAILDKNPIKDITGFHPPAGGPVNAEFNSLSANYFAMLKGAKNPGPAKELLLHFLLPLESMDAIFSNAPGFALPAYEKLWDQSKYIPTNPVALEQKAVATSPTGNVVAGTYPGPSMNPAMGAAASAGIQNDMVADILRGTAVADAVKTCHDRYVKVFKEFNLPGQK